jgi:hypothetical protein
MKNSVKIVACCLAIALFLGLSGWSLAREDAGENAYEDRLAGVLLTTEYLDLFDMDRYLNDNIGSIMSGQTTMDGMAPEYQGRLYATMTEKQLTDENGNPAGETREYTFEGLEGIPHFIARVPATEGREGYTTSQSDEGITDGHANYNYGDDQRSAELKGTVYVSPAGTMHTYFFNPVYQSADGRVYVTSGSSGFSTEGTDVEGQLYSQTMSASTTVTENGKAVKDSVSVELGLSIMFAPEKIVILQMDENSAVLHRAEYDPKDVPEEIRAEDGAQYIVVETHSKDAQGYPHISRKIYDRGAESLESFFCREDNVCVKRWTRVKW